MLNLFQMRSEVTISIVKMLDLLKGLLLCPANSVRCL